MVKAVNEMDILLASFQTSPGTIEAETFDTKFGLNIIRFKDAQLQSCSCTCKNGWNGEDCVHMLSIFQDLGFNLDSDSITFQRSLSAFEFQKLFTQASINEKDFFSAVPTLSDRKFYIEYAPNGMRSCAYYRCTRNKGGRKIKDNELCVFQRGRWYNTKDTVHPNFTPERPIYYHATKDCFACEKDGPYLRYQFEGDTIYHKANIPKSVKVKFYQETGIYLRKI